MKKTKSFNDEDLARYKVLRQRRRTKGWRE